MANYQHEFGHFMHYSRQADSIANRITALKLPEKEQFRVVDVGSNDGTLTEKLYSALAPKHHSLTMHALEPNKETYVELEKRFQLVPEILTENLGFEQWAQKYKATLAGSIDLLLHSHTFYHFHRDSWKDILAQGNEFLGDDASQVIIVDSGDSSINGLKPELERLLGQEAKTQRYGTFASGHDMQKFFLGQGMDYRYAMIDQPIIVPKNRHALRNFARILGFVFRYDKDEILAVAKPQIIEFMQQYEQREEFRFFRVQDIFILDKK